MDKEKKNRSGSQSNRSGKSETERSKRQTTQPGAPKRSNRQTGDHERDDSTPRGADRNTTKKGGNSV